MHCNYVRDYVIVLRKHLKLLHLKLKLFNKKVYIPLFPMGMRTSKFRSYHVHSYSEHMHVRTYWAYKLVQMRIHARVNVHNTWYYCTSAVRRDYASVCLAMTVNFVGILSIFERVYDVYRPTLNDWPIREVKHWLSRGCPYI